MSTLRFPAPCAGVDRCCPAKCIRAARGAYSSRSIPRSQHGCAAGFTAIEVVIVVCIIAILAAIGYPSYVGYKVRANRAAAQAFLIDLANRQQLHFLDARAFTTSLANLGASPVPPEVETYYAIADPIVDNAATPPFFTLSAAARPGTIQAHDGDLAINSSGIRSGHW